MHERGESHLCLAVIHDDPVALHRHQSGARGARERTHHRRVAAAVTAQDHAGPTAAGVLEKGHHAVKNKYDDAPPLGSTRGYRAMGRGRESMRSGLLSAPHRAPQKKKN